MCPQTPSLPYGETPFIHYMTNFHFKRFHIHVAKLLRIMNHCRQYKTENFSVSQVFLNFHHPPPPAYFKSFLESCHSSGTIQVQSDTLKQYQCNLIHKWFKLLHYVSHKQLSNLKIHITSQLFCSLLLVYILFIQQFVLVKTTKLIEISFKSST